METLDLAFFEAIFPGVKSFQYEEVKQDQEAGTSKCFFIELSYENSEENSPRKLFAKFQLPNTEDKESLMNVFEREALHYNVLLNPTHFDELKARNSSPHPFYVPKIYYSSFHPFDKKSSVFLFEDLREDGWVCGNQLYGCDIETAKLVLSAAASFHARWWNTPIEELEKKYGILYNLDYISTPSALSSFFESVYPSFITKFGDRLQSLDDLETKFQLLSESIIPILEYFTDRKQRPKTIVHGDLRLDNLFFREKNGKKEVAVIDWQLSHVSHGVRDLGKFLILNVNCSVEEQRDLVRYYCGRLREEGLTASEVVDQEILKDFHKFSYIIIVSAILAWNTLCEGKVPDSLDYLVNLQRLQALYSSWIDRVVPYLVDEDYFVDAENLALDARAYDQFLSDKYDQDLNGGEIAQSFSKIVIALKPWEDQVPWMLIHQQIRQMKFDGLVRWLFPNNNNENNNLNNNNDNNNDNNNNKEDKEEKEEKEKEEGNKKEGKEEGEGEKEIVFGVGPFGMKIAKYSAVVDNLSFSLESFLSSLEDQFEEYLQAVELVSSDDLKGDLSSLSL